MQNSNELTLSVVVPAYNEEEVLSEFHRRLCDVLDKLSISSEILYINDGSNDRTLEVLNTLQDSRVAIIDLSRNFGTQRRPPRPQALSEYRV